MKKNLFITSLVTFAIMSANAQNAHRCTRPGAIQTQQSEQVPQSTNFALDAGITNNTTPLFVQRNKPVTISGVVHNFGLHAITSMRINYSVNGGTIHSSMVNNVNLVSKQDYQFAHDITWTPTQDGKYEIKVWVNSLNGHMDENPANDTITLKPQAVDSTVTKVPLYEEFKQASCDPCYQACPNIESVFSPTYKACNLIEYHVDWPGVDYMNDVTDVPFVTPRVNYYGVGNYGVPCGQLDGGQTDNVDPSSISTSNINTEIAKGSPFRISATATYTAATNTYAISATVKSFIATKSTLKLKLYAVLTLDTIKYAKDQSTEDPQSSFAAPLGTGSNPDNTYKYVTVFPVVAEDMLPSSSGTSLNTFAVNGTQTVNLNWQKNHPWGFCPKSGCVDNGTGAGGTIGKGSLVASTYDSVNNGVHIILFVESDSSLYVYQSLSIIPSTSPTGVTAVTNDSHLKIYPNPASGIVNVDFNLQQAQSVNIEVYNEVGQKVYGNKMDKVQAGEHLITIDSKAYAPGIYFVRFTSGNSSLTKKLIIE